MAPQRIEGQNNRHVCTICMYVAGGRAISRHAYHVPPTLLMMTLTCMLRNLLTYFGLFFNLQIESEYSEQAKLAYISLFEKEEKEIYKADRYDAETRTPHGRLGFISASSSF